MPYVTRNGVRSYYEVEGDGTPLVLIIGFLGSLDDWREGTRYTDALRDGFRLILLDPRGQGRSDKPHAPESYTLEERAGDVLAVLDELGIPRAHVWGYSTGGYVGFTLAIHAPERLLSVVIGGANPWRQVEDPTKLRFYGWLSGGMEGFLEEWERAFGPVSGSLRERWLRDEDSDALRASLLAPRRTQDITDALASIDLPALLYAGSGDNPEPVRQTASAMPNARFVEIDGMSHVEAFQRSDLVLPHVRPFLESAMPGR